jgi:glycosyltransferase involved in cell wall biosynthesis
VEEISGLLVHHPRYPLIPKLSMPLHGMLMYAGCCSFVRHLHRQRPFDCIDAHYVFPDGLAAVLIGRTLGIPVTLTARGTDIHTFPNFTTIRPQIRWALRHAHGVAAVAPSLARMMLQMEPAVRTVEVIGNGVDTRRFFQEDRTEARRKLGLGKEEKVIVSVAALKPVKGPDLLLNALALLQKKMPSCRVLFVGKGPELSRLKTLASRLEVAERVDFIGAVDNDRLRYYYSAADVSCLASRNEGWPNVILESLACGTPVVATSVGAVPDLLQEPDLGTLVDASPHSLRDGLHLALTRSWEPDRLVEYARRHTWDRAALQTTEFLQSAISRKAATGYAASSANIDLQSS